jgi:hypothetical protein
MSETIEFTLDEEVRVEKAYKHNGIEVGPGIYWLKIRVTAEVERASHEPWGDDASAEIVEITRRDREDAMVSIFLPIIAHRSTNWIELDDEDAIVEALVEPLELEDKAIELEAGS